MSSRQYSVTDDANMLTSDPQNLVEVKSAVQ